MAISRKQFLWTVAAVTLTGCKDLPSYLRLGAWKPQPEAGPFQTPASDSVDLISHVLSRLAFGPRGGDYGRLAKLAPTQNEAVEAYIEEQLAPERIDDSALDHAIRRFDCLSEPMGELFEFKPRYLLREMTRANLLRAVWSRRQLYEVMVNFWTDHFNIDSSKGDCKWLKAADDRDVIRPHALGRFPDLLRASALSPAMLWYLDGRFNRKRDGDDKPNENYARELLELHTLGVHGGYTQHDVMEVARCLTGWNVRSLKQFHKGRVEFHPELHDDGAKLVLGQAIPAGLGERDLDRVLDIVSLHPATARHLSEKLCRRFIADEPPPPAVRAVSSAFLAHDGEIRPVLRVLFSRPEFQESRRTKIKRPFEFVASALRATNADTDAGPALIDYLPRMGHAPFQYPTPEGYSDRAAPWMGTLLWRWKFAAALSENAIAGTRIAVRKEDFGGEDGLMAHLLGRRPQGSEAGSFRTSGNGLALLLASPGFQRR
jgi:uncharacterized protein (DUF1800 family)